MKKKEYIYLLMGGLITAFSSCSDFLSETSQDEFEPKTVQAYQEILNGSAYAFSDFESVTDLMTDDVTGAAPSGDTYYTTANLVYRDVFAWQSYMYQTFEDNAINNITNPLDSYQDLYKYIMVCNLVIDGVGDKEGTEVEKNQAKGEALALRAYYYWYLVNLYCKPYNTLGTTPNLIKGVPLITAPEIKDVGTSRNSLAQVYAQIVSDVEEACNLLEEANQKNLGVYRVGRAGAHLIASRIYLYMENWDKVIEHVEKSLETAPSLCNLNTYTLTNANYPSSSTNQIVSANFPETILLGGMSIMGGASVNGSLLQVSNDLLNMYDKTNDSRFKIFFEGRSYLYYGYIMAKRGMSEKCYVWRTAELYLNRAEAYAQKYLAGDQASGQKAVDDLNTLRENRIKNYEVYQLTDAASLLQFCRDERRRELCFEFHRWFDLRRYGMPQLTHTFVEQGGVRQRYTLKEADPGYVLPIPDEALKLNPNLEQNELAPKRVPESI